MLFIKGISEYKHNDLLGSEISSLKSGFVRGLL